MPFFPIFLKRVESAWRVEKWTHPVFSMFPAKEKRKLSKTVNCKAAAASTCNECNRKVKQEKMEVPGSSQIHGHRRHLVQPSVAKGNACFCYCLTGLQMFSMLVSVTASFGGNFPFFSSFEFFFWLEKNSNSTRLENQKLELDSTREKVDSIRP